MAGGVGFEPTHAGAKDPCLTNLANPQQFILLCIPVKVYPANISEAKEACRKHIWTWPSAVFHIMLAQVIFIIMKVQGNLLYNLLPF